MNFEKRPRPAKVEKAIKSGDTEAVRAFSRAGGEATAKKAVEKREAKRKEEEFRNDVFEEIAQHRRGNAPLEPAEARRDDLLPPED